MNTKENANSNIINMNEYIDEKFAHKDENGRSLNERVDEALEFMMSDPGEETLIYGITGETERMNPKFAEKNINRLQDAADTIKEFLETIRTEQWFIDLDNENTNENN